MALSRSRQGGRRRLSFTGMSRDESGESDRICKLCRSHHHQLSTPSQLRNEDVRRFVISLQVQSDEATCTPCKDDVTRVLANPSHIPRWMKGSITDKGKCYILQCSESVFVRGRLATSEHMQAALEQAGLQSSSDSIPVPTPLCKHHYHSIYNLLQPTQTNCITCGVSLRWAASSSRCCPNPEVIEKHLQENTGFDGHIGPQDKVCNTCYRSHLTIINKSDSATSTDDDLKQLVSTFSHQIPTTYELKSINDVLCAAMMKTTVLVGRELLTNNAMLLPAVHDSFCEYTKELLKATNLEGEEVEVNKLFSSRWILSNLTANL